MLPRLWGGIGCGCCGRLGKNEMIKKRLLVVAAVVVLASLTLFFSSWYTSKQHMKGIQWVLKDVVTIGRHLDPPLTAGGQMVTYGLDGRVNGSDGCNSFGSMDDGEVWQTMADCGIVLEKGRQQPDGSITPPLSKSTRKAREVYLGAVLGYSYKYKVGNTLYMVRFSVGAINVLIFEAVP